MNDQPVDKVSIGNSNKYRQTALSQNIQIYDSHMINRTIPLPLVKNHKTLQKNSHDNNTNESIATENQCLSFSLPEISKRMHFFNR